MAINSVSGLEPNAVIQRKDGRLYRLTGYWVDPVLIIDPIEADGDGAKGREYICVTSAFADDLTVLVPKP